MRFVHSFLILFLFLAAGGAYAMQCAPVAFEDNVNTADVIFEGVVKTRVPYEETTKKSVCWPRGGGDKSKCGGKIATFEIKKLWKGNYSGKALRVYSEDGCYCLGSYFETGKTYIVFASRVTSAKDWLKHYLRAGNVCQGTVPAEDTTTADALRKQLDDKFLR